MQPQNAWASSPETTLSLSNGEMADPYVPRYQGPAGSSNERRGLSLHPDLGWGFFWGGIGAAGMGLVLLEDSGGDYVGTGAGLLVGGICMTGIGLYGLVLNVSRPRFVASEHEKEPKRGDWGVSLAPTEGGGFFQFQLLH